MSVKGEIKEGAGFVKEEMNEHGKSPESQRKAQEGRDLRNEGRVEDGKPPKTKNWRSFPIGPSKSARRARCFAWRLLRTTTLAGPAARSRSSPRTRRRRLGKLHPCTMPSDGIGGIRASPSAMPWRRRKPT